MNRLPGKELLPQGLYRQILSAAHIGHLLEPIVHANALRVHREIRETAAEGEGPLARTA
jgi:hypothetical protein